MAARRIPVSACISEEVLALLDAVSETRGLSRDQVIEEALRHYLHALRELPSDVIPTRLVLTEASARRVLEQVTNPREPTEAMRALMCGDDGDDVPA